MKKNILTLLIMLAAVVQLTACETPEPTCKEPDCEELEIYQDGYCKYHYYLNVGETALKDLINR